VWLGSWLWKKNWPRQWKKEFLELRPALLLVTEKQEAEKQPASQPATTGHVCAAYIEFIIVD
jgi:hypothetical protein